MTRWRHKPTFEQIETALDDGKLEMKRPWGDWVPVRRRAVNSRKGNGQRYIHVWMENHVEGIISESSSAIGFPDVRIAE